MDDDSGPYDGGVQLVHVKDTNGIPCRALALIGFKVIGSGDILMVVKKITPAEHRAIKAQFDEWPRELK